MNPFGGVRSTEQENFAIRTSLNLTVTPRQGNCGGRFSSLDGRNGYNKLFKIFFGILTSRSPFHDLWLYPRIVVTQKMMLAKSWMHTHELLPQTIAMDKIPKGARTGFELIPSLNFFTFNFFKAPFSEMDQHFQIQEKSRSSYNLKLKRLSRFQRRRHDC